MHKIYPTKLKHFISLETDRELSFTEVKQWYNIVKKSVSGEVRTFVMVPKENEGSKKVFLLKKKYKNNKYEYQIPLVRNISEKEFNSINKEYQNYFPGTNYSLKYSDIQKYELIDPELPISINYFQNFCEKISKYQHNQWVQDRMIDGWRYGLKFDYNNKTSPMLRSWIDLPDEYRKIDTKLGLEIFNILKREGFKIVKK